MVFLCDDHDDDDELTEVTEIDDNFNSRLKLKRSKRLMKYNRKSKHVAKIKKLA